MIMMRPQITKKGQTIDLAMIWTKNSCVRLKT